VADAPGADGGTITLIDHASSPAEAVPGGGSVQIDGDYGTLTIYANGDYSYQRAQGTPGGVDDVFTYTLTDGDGDSTTATLTISIDDNFPTLADPDTIHLDDDVIPAAGGNLDGPGDNDPDAVPGNVVEGQLDGQGGDAPRTYNFTGDDTLPSGLGFTIGAASDADTVFIVQDQNGSPVTVMTIQLDQSDGSFTVTQNAPLLHDPTNPGAGAGQAGNFEDNLNFSIGVEVEDADHDVEAAHITINVDDDTPTINVTQSGESAVVLTTDDAQTIGVGVQDTAQSTANFTGVFGLTQSAGADGTNAAATLAYTLDVTGFVNGGPGGVNSGLESHDVDIFLYEIGGKVVGSTSATLAGVTTNNTVFDVGVTSPGGVVTLTQYQQIDHDTIDPSPTGGPDYADHIVSMTDNLITLTASATLTDKDGDTVTDSEVANIGANLRFTDDGPDAQNSATPVGSVTLDESAEGFDRGPGAGAPVGDPSNTIDFSVNFLTGGSVDYGADGPGSATYALSLTGTGSGLFALDGTDTSATDGDGYGKGLEIQLSQVGNIISGKVGATTYFTIEINPNTGVVTFTQVNNIWHPTPGTASFDETATLTMATADLMKVIQTVTDFDGDTDTASINIGQGVFSIQDDGPQAIQPDDATVEDTAGESALGVPLDDDGSLLGDFGTDLPGKITFANITPGGMATTETADDKPIELWLSADGQTLTGRTDSTDGTDGTLIYTVHINANGTYDFTLNNPIDNGSGFEFNNLTSTKAGTTLVYGIGADAAGSPDIDAMLTGTHSGVNSNINTNATSIGIANQSFNPTDAIRIDFVTNMDTNAGTTIGFDYTAHVETNGYQQKVPQVVGNPSEVSFKVWAIESDDTQATYPDSNPAGGFGDDPTVTITEVWVVGHTAGEPKIDPVDISGLANGDTMAIAYGISVTRNADGSVTFSGVEQNDSYGIGTGANEFNAVAVQDVTGKFDLGIFALTTTNQGDPVHLAFDLNITDADGDTILLTDAINVTVNPAGADTLAATTLSVSESHVSGHDTSSFSSLLASDTLQVEKSAANSNTTLLAAAVAASGFVGTQAAAASPGNSDFGHQMAGDSPSLAAKFASLAVDPGGENRSMLSGETKVAANDEVQTLSQNQGHTESAQSTHGLDNAGAHMPAELSAIFASADQGPAADAQAAGPVAPAVAMVSAEALQAAGVDGTAKHAGVVEKVLADALGHDGPPTVDGLLQAIGGQGGGQLAAISHVASPAADAVPAWDMAAHGAFVPGADMMFKMGAEMLHHDAVQPVVNG
jgi:VCBS repeat-containing protein